MKRHKRKTHNTSTQKQLCKIEKKSLKSTHLTVRLNAKSGE